jgi:osmotically-inducible protein OsmY
VVTTNHDVYLLGDVTKTEATAVINNVKKINGVKKVVSLLNVTSDS